MNKTELTCAIQSNIYVEAVKWFSTTSLLKGVRKARGGTTDPECIQQAIKNKLTGSLGHFGETAKQKHRITTFSFNQPQHDKQNGR